MKYNDFLISILLMINISNKILFYKLIQIMKNVFEL